METIGADRNEPWQPIYRVAHLRLAEKIGLNAGNRQAQLGGRVFVLGGDIIVGVDGETIRGAGDLTTRIAAASAGQKMILTVVGQNSTRRLALVIPEMQDAR